MIKRKRITVAMPAYNAAKALAAGADIVVIVHPDYQYVPLLVTSVASMIACGVYAVVAEQTKSADSRPA
jgi:hypothetical protein